MAWILFYKRCKRGEKICYSSRDIEFFLGDYFFGAPCSVGWIRSIYTQSQQLALREITWQVAEFTGERL